MRGWLFTVGLLALSGLAVRADEDEPLPLVHEAYDAVVVVHERSESRAWEVSRVYFLRQGRVIADRILCEDMLWSAADGRFLLVWNDYGNCQRVITTRAVTEVQLELDDADGKSNDSAPWWGMARRMTDLRAPGADE